MTLLVVLMSGGGGGGPLCTTGNLDVGVDPNILNLTDSTGFAIGDTITIENGIGPGSPLITTITNLVGNAATIAATATIDIVGEQVCKIGSGTNTGWFGPDGPCECGCTCTCDEARTDYSHTSVAFSGGAAAATWYAIGDPTTTYAYPGISNASTAIDVNSCMTTIGSTHNHAYTPTGGWDNYNPPSGAYIQASDAILYPQHSQGYATVVYRCADSVYDYELTVGADYHIGGAAGDFDYTAHPSWTWIINDGLGGTPYTFTGTKTIGAEYHYFRLETLPGTITYVRYEVTVSAPTLTVSLGTPPYDPMGLLVGTATITP